MAGMKKARRLAAKQAAVKKVTPQAPQYQTKVMTPAQPVATVTAAAPAAPSNPFVMSTRDFGKP